MVLYFTGGPVQKARRPPETRARVLSDFSQLHAEKSSAIAFECVCVCVHRPLYFQEGTRVRTVDE